MDLKELLGEELHRQVMEKIGDQHKIAIVSDGNWIPKEKFDMVNSARRQLRDQLKERDEQLEELGKKAKGHNELQQQILELQEKHKKQAEEYQRKLDQQQFDFALEKALSSAKARNPKAVKALLDLETVKLDEDGTLKGLEDQIKKLRESDGYLFEEAEETSQANKPTFTTGQHTKQSQTEMDKWIEAFKLK